MIENEARFHLPDDQYAAVVDRFNQSQVLGPFTLVPKGQKTHEDTYFDIDGKLRDRGWSLRIRTFDENVRVTLKTPVLGESPTLGKKNEELENTANVDLFDTISEVINRLAGENIIRDAPSDLPSQLLLQGAYPTLQKLGLKDLFTVRTSRHRWIVSDKMERLAELTVDESFYDVNASNPNEAIREFRVEVELLDPDLNESLTQICESLTSEFRLEEVRDSKFERACCILTPADSAIS